MADIPALKEEIEEIWNGQTMAIVLFSFGAGGALWAVHSSQLPGVSIAILGSVAAVMSLRPKMEMWERAAWMILISVLLYAEIHSIRRDRTANDAAQKVVRDDENEKFANIVNGLTDAVTLASQQYQSTIAHVDGVLNTTQIVSVLAQKNLDNLTGGDSVAYLAPQPELNSNGAIPLAIVNSGKYPLSGVTVSVTDVTYLPFHQMPTLIVGTLASHVVRDVDLSIKPQPKAGVVAGYDVASFSIDIYAQNGTAHELLQFRKGKKMSWDSRLSLTREAPVSGSMIPRYSKPTSDIKSLTFDTGWAEDRSK